jgi:excisionase family DNA binding protein
MAESEELLTVAEIAASLKMNQQTIRNWIDSGYLPAIRIGRRVRVKRSDFDAPLEANYTGTKQTPAGVWDGDVLTPVAPGEEVEAGEAEPDKAAERPAG